MADGAALPVHQRTDSAGLSPLSGPVGRVASTERFPVVAAVDPDSAGLLLGDAPGLKCVLKLPKPVANGRHVQESWRVGLQRLRVHQEHGGQRKGSPRDDFCDA